MEATTARERTTNKASVTEPTAAKTSASKSSASCKDGDNCDVSHRAKGTVQDEELPRGEGHAEHR